MIKFSTKIACSLMLLSTSYSFAGDAVKGKMKYSTCMGCHGVKGEGNEMLKAPSIAGQKAWYLKAQLGKFKSGLRGSNPKDISGAQMKMMSRILATDQDVDNVTAYIASLPPIKNKTSEGDIAKGKMHFMTCMACHGAKAEGNVALKAPALKTLPAWYIVKQLKNFKAGIRGSNPEDVTGALMANMAKTVANEDAMKDLAAYILSL